MPSVTLVTAIFLILTGVIAYVSSGMASVTALIPSFFGVPLFICGLVAFKDSLRKHAMHGAAALSLLGILGSAPGLFKIPALLAGTAERPLAVIVQSVMAVVLIAFLVLCVRSFISARRQRQAAEAQAA